MAFYEVINEFSYNKESNSTHPSPTKRLIEMKNSTVHHMREIKDRRLDKKGLVYIASPKKSYVVEEERPLRYDLAFKKNPSTFFEKAGLDIPVTRHKIASARNKYKRSEMDIFEVSSKTSARPMSVSALNFTSIEDKRETEAESGGEAEVEIRR